MNRRVTAVVLALLVAGSASAQTIGSVVAPRLSGGAPTVIIPVPALSGVPGAMPLLSATALTPALAVSAIAPAPAAAAPAAVPTALNAVQALNGALSAASVNGKDQAPALAAAFDGLKAASTPDDVAVPTSFVEEARRRFSALKQAEAEAARAARPEGAVPSDDDMQGRMDRLPSTNPERMKFIADLFKLGGATDADIKLQDAGRGRNNVIVTIPGKTDRVVVIGAHYDKVSEGLGKIDNGTGSTMVANLYQAMHGTRPDATLVFIAFAREEEGLIGSSVYVRSLSAQQRSKIDAMINLDTLAVDGTFSWKNSRWDRKSTPKMLERFAQVSRESGHALTEAPLSGGDADSSSFRDAGIPAVTIYGASQDVIFDIIHSERDTMAAFSLAHYKNAYLLVLEAIKSLDRTPLGPVGREEI